jgi:hypothetical protein
MKEFRLMSNFENILSKRIQELGIERQVEAVGVVEDAVKVIAEILPRQDFEVISFKDGVLKVAVASCAAASELQISSAKVIADAGQSTLKRLRIIPITEIEKESE